MSLNFTIIYVMAEDHGFNIARPRHSLGKMILTISRIQIQNRNQKLPIEISFVGVKYICLLGDHGVCFFFSSVADICSCEFLVNISRRLIHFVFDFTNFLLIFAFLISQSYFLVPLNQYSSLHSNVH